MKSKKRSRRRRKLKRDNETMQERMLRTPMGHGGRAVKVQKEKTKYDRKKEKKVDLEE